MLVLLELPASQRLSVTALEIAGSIKPRHLPRPPDRCRGLAVEDQCQGGAPAAKRGRTTLTVIFARRQDARREEDGPVGLRWRGHRAALGPAPPAAGAGELTGVRRRARRASARRGAAGRRPTVGKLPTALPLCAGTALASRSHAFFPMAFVLATADPAPGPDGWRAEGAPLKPWRKLSQPKRLRESRANPGSLLSRGGG